MWRCVVHTQVGLPAADPREGELAAFLRCGGQSCAAVATPKLDKAKDCQDAPFPGAACSTGFQCTR
jgi:hypothetical protein